MSSKKDAVEIIKSLSEAECKEILFLLNRVQIGQRQWEGDIALAYNEFVKMRGIQIRRGVPLQAPNMPSEDDLPSIPLPPITKRYIDQPKIKLPSPLTPSSSLAKVLSQRRSRRDYIQPNLSQEELSTILYYSAGINAWFPAYGFSRLPLRMFPSSGGLQSPEIYVAINSVEDLTSGVYHYQPDNHSLEMLKKEELRFELKDICLGQDYVAQASILLIITGFYERLRWKYGERAYRYMCMDAGFLGQNVYLISGALGIGVCAIAGFMDDKLNVLLGIDGISEMPLLVMTLGRINHNNQG